MTDFANEARGLIGVIDARRSGIEPAGGFERPAAILDWHYAGSPFCAEMQRERIGLLGTAAPSSEREGDLSSPYTFPLLAALRADNDNNWLRLVR